MSAMPDEEYLTVAEAAALLKVSQSTIWRWIDQGDLSAYRVGQRRVRLRRRDLARLITPIHRRAEGRRAVPEADLSRPLSGTEQKRMLDAIEQAERFQQELLKRRGGKLFSSSTEIIRELRRERTDELS